MRTELGKALEREEEAARVFQRVLVPHLGRHGAATSAALVNRGIELFRLELDDEEVLDVLELSRRKGLVEPLGQAEDAYGETISAVEWAPSESGQALKRPRGLNLASFRDYLMEVTPAGPKVAKAVQYVVVTFLAALPLLGASPADKGGAGTKAEDLSDAVASLDSSASAEAGVLVAAAVVVLLFGLAIARGMAGDSRLRRAARAWSRLRETWPSFWRWQVSWVRPWLSLVAFALIAAPFAARPFLEGGEPLLLIPYGLGILLWIGLYLVRRHCDKQRAEGADGTVRPSPTPQPAKR
jgi:hypothetical protein